MVFKGLIAEWGFSNLSIFDIQHEMDASVPEGKDKRSKDSKNR